MFLQMMFFSEVNTEAGWCIGLTNILAKTDNENLHEFIGVNDEFLCGFWLFADNSRARRCGSLQVGEDESHFENVRFWKLPFPCFVTYFDGTRRASHKCITSSICTAIFAYCAGKSLSSSFPLSLSCLSIMVELEIADSDVALLQLPWFEQPGWSSTCNTIEGLD